MIQFKNGEFFLVTSDLEFKLLIQYLHAEYFIKVITPERNLSLKLYSSLLYYILCTYFSELGKWLFYLMELRMDEY